MWIGVISLFPEMFKAITEFGVTGRAVKHNLLQVECWNPRDFTFNKHKTVDDRPYGCLLYTSGVKSVGRDVSKQLINDDNLPHIQHSMTYEPYTYFFDGRVGYDVQYMNQDELIADMLKHYDRYLSLLDNVGQELMAHEQTELAE